MFPFDVAMTQIIPSAGLVIRFAPASCASRMAAIGTWLGKSTAGRIKLHS